MKKVNNILKNTAVACAILLISGGSIKGQWTPATVPADTYWSPTTSSVGIGVVNPQYKLHVVDDNTNPGGSAGQFEYTSPTNVVGTYFGLNAICTDASGNGNDNIGIQATAQDGGVTNTGNATGFQGFAIKTGNGNTYGGNLSATGGDIAYGINATANSAGTDNYGVYGATGGTGGSGNNIGVYGFLANNAGTMNAAIYGDANGYSNSGVSEFAGYFDGDIRVTGDGYKTGSTWNTSDSRLKRNVKPYQNALEKLLNVKIYDYEYREDVYQELRLPKGNQVGVLAQELESVLPELVKPSYKGLLHVSYETFVPILIKAMQEQQQQIELMKESLTASAAFNTDNMLGVDQVGVVAGSRVEQNIPNPFTGETVINYNLNQEINTASLFVYDLTGKQIAEFDLEKRGSSSYTLSAANLSAGIYFYSIIADGKIVGTKRMVIASK